MSSWISTHNIRRPRVMPSAITSNRLVTAQSILSFTPTFHILIATAGKPTLRNMLNSLKNELTEKDAITIVFDGDSALSNGGFSYEWLEGHKSIINIIEQVPNLGFWGHGIRNKYQELLNPKTTFIMHADDDDVYVQGSFNKLRQLCTDSNTLYIARFFVVSKNVLVPSQVQQIVKDDIGTPCGIIPFDIANKSEWAYKYGGDFDYYNTLQSYVSNKKFLNTVIYQVL
jgi:hypothetical protein